jgi:hypothetical protein
MPQAKKDPGSNEQPAVEQIERSFGQSIRTDQKSFAGLILRIW